MIVALIVFAVVLSVVSLTVTLSMDTDYPEIPVPEVEKEDSGSGQVSLVLLPPNETGGEDGEE